MSDQCKHCMVRGNLEKCQKTVCTQHESWMVNKLNNIIDDLRGELTVVAAELTAKKKDKHLLCKELRKLKRKNNILLDDLSNQKAHIKKLSGSGKVASGKSKVD